MNYLFNPNFLLCCSSLGNRSAGHYIWGFVQGFAVGLPLPRPTACAPLLGTECQEILSFSPRLSSSWGSVMCVYRGDGT